MLPGATFGGAVIFSEKGQTGAKEVDGKFNAIMASELGVQAMRHGHSDELAKAMILPEAHLFAAREKSGHWTMMHDEPPADKYEEVTSLNRGERVVVLDDQQCIKFQIAQPMDRVTDDNIRKLLHLTDGNAAGDDAKKAAKLGNDRAGGVKKKLINWWDDVHDNLDRKSVV